MVSNVESSVKSTNSKSVVKSIKSVFSKKPKSKDKAPEVKTAEEESIERNTVVENIDGARDMPAPAESDPLDSSQIEQLQEIVKNTESTSISKLQDEEVASKKSTKSSKSALSRLSLKGKESSASSEKSPIPTTIAEEEAEATVEKSPTVKDEVIASDEKQETAADPIEKEETSETVAPALATAEIEAAPSSPSTVTKTIASDEPAKPGFFCFAC